MAVMKKSSKGNTNRDLMPWIESIKAHSFMKEHFGAYSVKGNRAY